MVTGTPGTGKTTLATQIVDAVKGRNGEPVLRHIDVGPLAKSHNFFTSYDEEWGTHEVDEDQLLDFLEPLSGGTAPDPLDVDPSACEEAQNVADDDETRGGLLLDWHTCDAWPERWVDLVLVLRCDHEVLWKRLEKRYACAAHPGTIPKRKSPRTTKRKSWASSRTTRTSPMHLNPS